MHRFNNPFKSKDEKELKYSEQELNKQLNLVGDKARNCLNSELFKVYKDQFSVAEQSAMDNLIKLNNLFLSTEMDAVKFALKVSACISSLSETKRLLTSVQRDAKKGKSND